MKIDRPHITVAAICEKNGRFLCVEEISEGKRVYNQPAGHLEPGETLLDAVIRETQEESGWTFQPESIVGIYNWTRPEDQRTYVRVTFCGSCGDHHPEQPLDQGIEQALWLTRDELVNASIKLRSPMVLHCIDDYLAGERYPLELISEI
ncbi:NUDIX hydrolase [Solemya pervernicosa gill symbiont]|uniref:Phosphatase NudJ n=2 Tax=Gammaproteobacteria incertae sedis TaxID=118884 RepID=A0A1T2LA82_9GAMM|nr:NUDIX hydrolase [Candidatus Reidiella endopervernicosa]OOZ42001.1 NUDIX hydrolase [Solemya pervernicosa gill symbiont]QKQ27056.1 NUDIX hydrolase [Candidatus Reidiella endopervernicosa]